MKWTTYKMMIANLMSILMRAELCIWQSLSHNNENNDENISEMLLKGNKLNISVLILLLLNRRLNVCWFNHQLWTNKNNKRDSNGTIICHPLQDIIALHSFSHIPPQFLHIKSPSEVIKKRENISSLSIFDARDTTHRSESKIEIK